MTAVTIAPPAPEMIPARHKGGTQTPTLSVIHATVSSDNPGTARDIAEWWHGPTSPVTSAHYVIDPTTILQCVGDHTVAFHCGYNPNSLAWELCDEQTGPASRWADADSKAIIARAQENIARAHLAYGIPIRLLSDDELRAWDRAGRPARLGGIVTHAQMSRVFKKSTHTDPRELNMTSFVKGVIVEAAGIKKAAAAPVPVVAPPALRKPRKVPARWASFLHTAVYWLTDSVRGVKAAAKRKGDAKAIDLNTCGRTKDGVIVCLHWPQPLLHGWKWDKSTPAYLRKLPKTVTIHELTFAEARHLVAGKGYRINRLSALLALAARLGVRVEVEAKGGHDTADRGFWREVMSWAGSKSLARRGLLQGKTLVLIPGAPKRVRAMKAADMVVIVSTTDAKSKRLELAKYAAADFVRGPVVWVV